MIPLDYGRSFLIGNGPSNEVRFWAESRTRIIDEETGESEDYLQCGSCKSEDTFAEKDLFSEDNYDFLPIFGPEYGIVFRRKAWLNPGYKSIVPAQELWNGQDYHLVEDADAQELETNEAVLQATYDFAPVVSQTEIRSEDTKLRAIIECPVKTLNTNRERCVYQVDTGPVAFPDLTQRHERHADGICLAFVAFNVPHFADFVVEVATRIGEGESACAIHHYSERLSLPAVNRVYAVRA